MSPEHTIEPEANKALEILFHTFSLREVKAALDEVDGRLDNGKGPAHLINYAAFITLHMIKKAKDRELTERHRQHLEHPVQPSGT